MKTITSLLLLGLLATGCGQAATTTTTPTSSSSPPATGGSSTPGVAPDVPISGPGDGDGRVMPPFKPTWVVPHPGGGPLTPVSPSGLRVGTRDGAAYAVVRWWSGIEPCSVLRSVAVKTGAATVRLRLVEGTDDPGAACPELAMLKATRVDLGGLEPGTYTVIAGGERRTLTV